MELASYDQYEKMFGAGPMSSQMAMRNDELARMFQEDKLQRQQFDTTGAGLDTMYKADNYGNKLRQSGADADKAMFEASDAGVKNRINTATEGLQLDAAQKELVTKASKADLDQFEFGAQRMAYSKNPQERAEGERLLKMHKEFLKLRESQGFAASEAEKQRKHAFALENLRNRNATERAQKLAAAKLAAKSGTEKMTMDQRISHYAQLAQQAKAAGDAELALEYYNEAQYLSSLKASQRPDTGVGKIDQGAVTGLPVVPPKAPVQPPINVPQAPVQQTQPKPTLSSVQQMYPGVPPEKLRDAYKKKFGVDLQ